MPKTPGLKTTFRQYRKVVQEHSKPLSDAEKYRQGNQGNRSQSSENTIMTVDELVEEVAELVRNHEPLQQLVSDAQNTKVYPLY